MPRRIVVGIAECAVTSDSDAVLMTYALGSCIAVALCDPQARVGGLLHFMLPESSLDSARGQANPHLYGDTGITALYQACLRLGADRSRLGVFAAGGAQVLDGHSLFNIGARNYDSYKLTLARTGLKPNAEALGGTVSRSMRLEVGTGKCFVREGMTPEAELTPVFGKRRR